DDRPSGAAPALCRRQPPTESHWLGDSPSAPVHILPVPYWLLTGQSAPAWHDKAPGCDAPVPYSVRSEPAQLQHSPVEIATGQPGSRTPCRPEQSACAPPAPVADPCPTAPFDSTA